MAAETTSGNGKNKLFFVKNSEYNTKSLELYLNRRGFEVNSASDLTTSVEKINEFKPQYLFVAWDHKNLNIPDLLSVVQNDEVVVVPYITSTANSDAHRLMQVDAPIKLFPPVSGPAIQRIILKYEKDKSSKKNQKSNLISAAAKNQTAKNTMISNSGINESQPQKIYINKGQKIAEMKKMAQSASQLEGEVGFSNDLYQSFFDSITDMTEGASYSQFSRSHHVKISDFQKHAVSHLFESKIKNELSEIIETAKESAPVEKANVSFGVLVQSADCSGVILLQSEWDINQYEVEPALTSWAKELTSYFYKNQNQDHINHDLYRSPILEITLPHELNIFEAINKKSAVSKELMIDDKKTVLAFFDLAENPFNIEPNESEKYLLVDPLCFRQSTKVPFDVFLELKENKKIIKYIKAETELSEKEITSLAEKKSFPVLIENQNELAWYKYGVESFLNQL